MPDAYNASDGVDVTCSAAWRLVSGLRIRDPPIHFKERTYGKTNISRLRHGWLLIRMTGRAALRVKFVG